MESRWIPKKHVLTEMNVENKNIQETDVELDFGIPPDEVTQAPPHLQLHSTPTISSIHTKNSEETIVLLEQLLTQARSGHLIGLANVSLYLDSTYSLKLCGDARSESEQMSVAGMLAALQKMVLENH